MIEINRYSCAITFCMLPEVEGPSSPESEFGKYKKRHGATNLLNPLSCFAKKPLLSSSVTLISIGIPPSRSAFTVEEAHWLLIQEHHIKKDNDLNNIVAI